MTKNYSRVGYTRKRMREKEEKERERQRITVHRKIQRHYGIKARSSF